MYFLLLFPVLIFQYAEQLLSDESSILFGNFQPWLVFLAPCAPCLLSFMLFVFLPSFFLFLCRFFVLHLSHRMSQPSPLPRLKRHLAAWLQFRNDPKELDCSQMTKEERWLRSFGELLLWFALWSRRELPVCHLQRQGNKDKYIKHQPAAKVGAITCHHCDMRFPSGYTSVVTLSCLRSVFRDEGRSGTDWHHFVPGAITFWPV